MEGDEDCKSTLCSACSDELLGAFTCKLCDEAFAYLFITPVDNEVYEYEANDGYSYRKN